MVEARYPAARGSGKPRSQTSYRLSVLRITSETRVFYGGPRCKWNFVTSARSSLRSGSSGPQPEETDVLSLCGAHGLLSRRVTLYSLCMPTSIAEFARAASDAVRTRTCFEARQSVRAGKIDVTARVRFRAPDRTTVEFSAYASPFAEMDDLLGGSAELAPEDLVGASLAYDGRLTRSLHSKTSTAFVALGRRLYEPLPGYDALAELSFLDDIARDYLLRDAGETVCAGRTARILGLRPKRPWVSSLFRTKAFLLERAEVTLDAETFFPLRVDFVPGRGTPAASVLGADGRVTIEYSDVRLGEIDEATFAPAPPVGARVFTEELVAPDRSDALPFPLPIGALATHGFDAIDDRAAVVLDAARERGYATVAFHRAADDERTEAVLVVRVGNYVSRLMARRRTMAGERGEVLDLRGGSARYVDRRALLGADAAARGVPLLADLVWERDGVFWVVSGEALTREALLSIASDLA